MSDPWRAKQFDKGYSAEFLPPGQRTWRMVKSGGEPIVFGSFSEAHGAAKNAFLQRLEPTIRATLPVDPDRIAAKLADEAENWLKSKREDVKASSTLYRPGRKHVIVMAGRAR
ncbi:MAG: hypothetical protein AB7I42_25015 [Bradyrhizobium sp.]|uniref:hypothetical protein n=1 Tax=Bradyrhizobium sp. TaxID=376 RepID=UPI003D128B0D